MKLNFAENLRSLRRGKDLTQEQLADLLAVSVQTVSRWENELTYPDVELLPVIAELFETSVDALLGVTEALKEQQISVFWEKLNRTESSRERTGILREAHRAFPRDLTFSARLCSSILYSDDPVSNPAALHEMRTLLPRMFLPMHPMFISVKRSSKHWFVPRMRNGRKHFFQITRQGRA